MQQSRTLASGEGTRRGTAGLRGDRSSVLVGLLVAVLVAGLGVLLLGFPARTWTATSSLIVLPSPAVSPTDAAGLYDQLDNQVVATFAQVVQSADATAAAPPSDQTQVVVTPVAQTTLISVTATSPDPQVSVQLADRVATSGVQTLGRLRTPFTTAVLSPAGPTLAPGAGSSPWLVIGVIAVVALVAGLAVQQGLWIVLHSLARRPRSEEETGARPAPEVAEDVRSAVPTEVDERAALFDVERTAPRYLPLPRPEQPDPTTTEISLVRSLTVFSPGPGSSRGAQDDHAEGVTAEKATGGPEDERPAAEEPTEDGRKTERPTAEEPTSEQSSADEQVADEQVADGPGAEERESQESAPGDPEVEEPFAEASATAPSESAPSPRRRAHDVSAR